jgi:hypothetical protein
LTGEFSGGGICKRLVRRAVWEMISQAMDLTARAKRAMMTMSVSGGRTGFDLGNAPEAACRGRCVGLVNHRIKQNS